MDTARSWLLGAEQSYAAGICSAIEASLARLESYVGQKEKSGRAEAPTVSSPKVPDLFRPLCELERELGKSQQKQSDADLLRRVACEMKVTFAGLQSLWEGLAKRDFGYAGKNPERATAQWKALRTLEHCKQDYEAWAAELERQIEEPEPDEMKVEQLVLVTGYDPDDYGVLVVCSVQRNFEPRTVQKQYLGEIQAADVRYCPTQFSNWLLEQGYLTKVGYTEVWLGEVQQPRADVTVLKGEADGPN